MLPPTKGPCEICGTLSANAVVENAGPIVKSVVFYCDPHHAKLQRCIADLGATTKPLQGLALRMVRADWRAECRKAA
jgi:hypothetical protein